MEELRKHLLLVKAQGKTVIVAEHRLHYLMDVADRVIYLEGGQIAGEYTPEELCALPAQKRREMGLRAVDLGRETPAYFETSRSAPVLEMKNVSLSYGKRTVLSDLSFQAAAGEVIALVGQNGAGKTTFSRALCGLHREDAGEYCWEGRAQKPGQRMKRAGMVMQDVNYQLFAESVAEECVFGVKRPDLTLAEEILSQLGLSPLRERHPGALSGGQKQRLAAAAAMVSGKQLLVFDEPTSGLDYDSMVRLSALIRRLAEDGRVIFIVTHDYEFICRTCSRALHLEGGALRHNLPVTAGNLSEIKGILGVR